MAETRTLLDNLKDRRVPQLVGMYVGATSLVIELGDWATEHFSLPLGRVRLVEGDSDAARALLQEALDTWSDADERYVHRIATTKLLGEL